MAELTDLNDRLESFTSLAQFSSVQWKQWFDEYKAQGNNSAMKSLRSIIAEQTKRVGTKKVYPLEKTETQQQKSVKLPVTENEKGVTMLDFSSDSTEHLPTPSSAAVKTSVLLI